MAIVQAQVQVDDRDPSTPVPLFTAAADCVVNVYCGNPDDEAQDAFVEVGLQDASQDAALLLGRGVQVPAIERLVDRGGYLASGATVYVYGSDAAQVFHLYGHTI